MVNVLVCSLPDREEQLKHTVFSLVNQVDYIHVVLNNYDHNPFENINRNKSKIKIYYSDNSLGDASRYIPLKNIYNSYIFTVDDDLIFDPYYIEDTLLRMRQSRYKIVSYHGRSFNNFPIESYYNSATKRCRCLDYLESDHKVQFGGSGCMAFHTSQFKPNINDFKRSNMSDIWIGLMAKKIGIQIYALKHEKGYIKYQKVQNTIWEAKHNNDLIETEIVNSYFK